MERFAKKNEMKIFQVSSQNKELVDEMFQKLVLDIIESMDDENLKNRADSIKLDSKNAKANKSGLGFNLGSYFKKENNEGYYKCC